MIRFWILALVLVAAIANVSEARGRNRVVRYQPRSYQTQSSVHYNTGTPQVVSSGNSFQNSQSGIQQVSYSTSSNINGGSVVSGHPMQAWAEEEARMMASRGTCGHVRGAPPGYFVGVGCGMTCIGSGTLVAEAHYQGKMVRVWQR